jgi:hypothetical protein
MHPVRMNTAAGAWSRIGQGIFWLGCSLSMLWMLFFLGEAIEGLMRGDVDVAGLALVGAGVIWCLGSGARHVMTAKKSTTVS